MSTDKTQFLKHWKAWMDTIPPGAKMFGPLPNPELVKAILHPGMGRRTLIRDALGVPRPKQPRQQIGGDRATMVIGDDVNPPPCSTCGEESTQRCADGAPMCDICFQVSQEDDGDPGEM